MCSKILTSTTESRAATATISAQEIIPGHNFSIWDLIVSITSKPLSEFVLGFADFSPVKSDVSSNNKDPSHPCQKQIHKYFAKITTKIVKIIIHNLIWKD